MIEHAHRNVPYYRRLFEQAGVRPADIRTAADLRRLPITDRADVQNLPDEQVLARGVDASRLIVHNTSGATGMPLTIRHTWAQGTLDGLLRRRARRQWGQRRRDRQATLGLERPAQPAERAWMLDMMQRLGLARQHMIDCRQDAAHLIEALRQYRPDVLAGFSGALEHVARALSEDDRRRIRPRLIAAGGETLTPQMRQAIGEGFGAPVWESYNCREVGLMAWQCPRGTDLHICEDQVILEVLRDGRAAEPGQTGQVVITGLASFAQPFIRYRTGDLATAGAPPCACGQPFATLQNVVGRMVDYMRLPDGRLLHAYALTLPLRHSAAWIMQYRFVQESFDSFVMLIRPHQPPSAQQIQVLIDHAHELLGPGARFEPRLVAQIPGGPGGKTRPAVSMIHSSYPPMQWDQLEPAQRP